MAPSSGEPCDACVSCRKIDTLNHPDVFLLTPEKGGSSIKIEMIRLLTKDIAMKPYEGRVKVYIIDEAAHMTEEAQNALLKTLEEPPSESVIILIAENLNEIPQTIISRSQVVRFFPLGIGEVKKILANDYSVEGAKAHILSHISSGRLGEALKYRDTDFFDKRSRVLSALLNDTFLDSDMDKVSKDQIRMYLDIMLSWYRDIITRKAGAGSSILINIDMEDHIDREARRHSFDYLDSMINQIILTNSLLDRNVNQKLAMSVLGVKICMK